VKRIFGCGCLITLLLLVPLCSFAGLAYVGLSGMREESPGDYTDLLSEGFGVRIEASAATYDFSFEDLEALQKDGLDPQEVGDAILAAQWADEVLGKGTESVGDPTILIALDQYESGGGCRNCGSSDAASEYTAHPALDAEAQKKALKSILAKAKEADIRSTNPNAAKYVYEDYSGALGSTGGGALGCSQFLAGTAVGYLEAVGSPDLWDKVVAKKYMAAELYRLGWRPNLSDAQKLGVLLKWNQDPNGLKKVIETAKVYLKYRSLRAKMKVLPGDWKAAVLGFLGLLPDGVAVYAAELPVTWSEEAISLNLGSDVPQGGERVNIEQWAKSNQRIQMERGEIWDFCTQTNQTGWSQYGYASGINAGGICANASMLRELADKDPRLMTIKWYPHKITLYPRYHTVVSCPGTTYSMKNVTDKTITVVWGIKSDDLAVWVEEGEANTNPGTE